LNFNLDSIEKKLDANWCRMYRKFACDYGIENIFLKRQIQKDTLKKIKKIKNQLNRF
jgi:hypothetical protein